jgi:hypothetical protein
MISNGFRETVFQCGSTGCVTCNPRGGFGAVPIVKADWLPAFPANERFGDAPALFAWLYKRPAPWPQSIRVGVRAPPTHPPLVQVSKISGLLLVIDAGEARHASEPDFLEGPDAQHTHAGEGKNGNKECQVPGDKKMDEDIERKSSDVSDDVPAHMPTVSLHQEPELSDVLSKSGVSLHGAIKARERPEGSSVS